MFHHHDRVRARRQRSASHDFERLAVHEWRQSLIAGAHFSGHCERSWKLFGFHGESIAERSLEGGIITIRENGFG
jgi:hypothetical protein